MKPLSLYNRNLAVVLALQVLLCALVWWPKSSSTMVERALFAGVDWEKVQAVTLSEADKQLVLKKENGAWIIPDQSNFPADEKRMAQLFEKLKALKIGPAVSKTAPSYERLQVADQKYQRKVVLGSVESDKSEGFYLGTSPQPRRTHVRRFNQDEVFTTDKLATFDLPMRSEDWLKRSLMSVDSKDISEIEITRLKETLQFKRVDIPAEKNPQGETTQQAQSVWMLGGKPVHPATFDAMLRNLAALSLTSVAGSDVKSAYGMSHPTRITLTVASGDKTEKHVFLVGAKKDTDFFVQSANSPFVVKVPVYQLSAALDAKRSDFLRR